MAYAQSDTAVFVNLYMGSTAKVTLKPAGASEALPIEVQQVTDYPWESIVNMTLTMPRAARFDVYLRLPAWCPGGKLFINDTSVQRDADFSHRGYVKLSREWAPGDRITFHMEMPVLRVRANPKVKGNVGRVALQRGPVVYCFEGVDNEVPDASVRGVALPVDATIEAVRDPNVLGGVVMLRMTGVRESESTAGVFPASSLYAPIESVPQPLTAVPYFAWANRAPGDMLVWIPESLALAEQPLDASIAASASHCYEGDSVTALYDGLEPANSGDHSIPRFTWWPRKGSTQWVQYGFASPREVSSVSVYWFDDHGRGGQCRLPVSWKLLYQEPVGASGAGGSGGADSAKVVWKEVPGVKAFGIKGDQFNRVEFPKIRVSGLRIEAVLAPKSDASAEGFSAGILEWKVE